MRKNGFTLIEVLISVAIMMILVSISIPIYQSLQRRNALDVAIVEITQTLRRAQVLSQSVDGDVNFLRFIAVLPLRVYWK
jgi:prepilin-type N-terminal cleavage/methylation domain-containing protein